jgi:hypothetical protein
MDPETDDEHFERQQLLELETYWEEQRLLTEMILKQPVISLQELFEVWEV